MYKKIIGHYFRYPLMWVMLLWALTLPGHEVIVYDYLIKSISKKAFVVPSENAEAFSRSKKLAQDGQVYLDAAASAAAGKHLEPAKSILSFLVYAAIPFHETIKYKRVVDRPPHLLKRFLVSVLPNAP